MVIAQIFSENKKYSPMNNNRSAFSLLELMVVLVIMVGITALSWPVLTRKIKSSEIKIFEQKIKETMEDARYQSIRYGKPLAVIIDNKTVSIMKIEDTQNKSYNKIIIVTPDGKSNNE